MNVTPIDSDKYKSACFFFYGCLCEVQFPQKIQHSLVVFVRYQRVVFHQEAELCQPLFESFYLDAEVLAVLHYAFAQGPLRLVHQGHVLLFLVEKFLDVLVVLDWDQFCRLGILYHDDGTVAGLLEKFLLVLLEKNFGPLLHFRGEKGTDRSSVAVSVPESFQQSVLEVFDGGFVLFDLFLLSRDHLGILILEISFLLVQDDLCKPIFHEWEYQVCKGVKFS